jgi:hypothetical protein
MNTRRIIKSGMVMIAAVVGLALAPAPDAFAAGPQTVYNSIPKSIPGNVGSEGPEAYSFRELGDGLNLVAEPASSTLSQVTVVLSSWACQNGHWYTGDCVTTAGATFTQPITVNVYQATAGSPPTAGTMITSMTQTFTLPYRPSSDATKCTGADAGKWYSGKDKKCFNGFAVPISFNFAASAGITLTPDIVVTFAFNTTSAGPSPLGTQACSGSSGGCPYDSLNISTDGSGAPAGSGSVLDASGIFVNYISSANACAGNTATTLADDTPCNTANHPQIQVVTKH